ncbi:MAG: FAD-dependent oxidoreductase [Syntrophothermus sp.]
MAQEKTIIVAGGNAAGPAAAAKAKRTDPSARVIMFEQSPFISTGTCELPYIISGEIPSYKEIVFFDKNTFEESKGVEVFTGYRIDEIDRRGCTVKISSDDGKSLDYRYDTLILATGSSAVKLPQLDDSAENLFYMKNVQDLIRLDEYIRVHNPENAFIIGSGYIGLEMAEALAKRGIEVTTADTDQLPLPASDPEIQHLVYEILKENGISFSGKLSEIRPFYKNNLIKSVRAEGRTSEFDMVLIAAGVRANNRLALQCRLELGKSGGLRVDKKLRTSDQRIWAAGDNIEVTNFITGRPEYLPLASIAQKSGHIAGENAAGGNKLFGSVIRNTAFRLFNNTIVITGLTAREAMVSGFTIKSVHAVSPNLIRVFPGSRNVFGKIIYESGSRRILGASFIGGNEAAGYGDLISSLIKSRSDASLLADLDYNYTPPVSPFINLLSILGRKVK